MTHLGNVLCLTTLAVGCGAGPAASAAARPTTTEHAHPRAPSGTRDEPRTATALVTTLRAIVSGARPGTVEEHVDRSFAERLPSGGTLDELFRGWPEGCVPTLSEGPGYSAVAIPPPMTDDSAETARIEAIIAELQAATEVEASCRVVETYQDEADEPATAHERTMMLFAIATRADAHGVFRALAWRDFRDDMPGNQ